MKGKQFTSHLSVSSTRGLKDRSATLRMQTHCQPLPVPLGLHQSAAATGYIDSFQEQEIVARSLPAYLASVQLRAFV